MAVEAGLLSSAQLADCLHEQESAKPGSAPMLGAILVRRGFLRPEDLEQLLAEQQRRLSEALDLSDPKIEDALLGRLLIRQGLATESQVFECLREQSRIAENGSGVPRLGELLVRKNYIASDAVDTALLLRKKEVFTCPSCSTNYSTLGADPGRKYTCRKCGQVLERQERLLHAGETTGALRADFPEDVAVHAKNPERRFAGGRYVLLEEVGRGGMGIVWKAWQTDLRRTVALKLLAGGGWSDHDLRRFHREAQTAAGLSHANIASIYEVGADAGRHYISMEFVEGESLTGLVSSRSDGTRAGTQRRAVGLRRGVEIVREAALAVEYAHSKGIIHRDLKPGNIMVARQGGRTYVMDFGLARPVRDRDTMTVSDAIVGTPSYMSPEQARGGALDRRADVYSLGAILYAVLAGRPPFGGRTPAETLMRVLSDDPAAPRRLNPRVHADLETICLKAMERDRSRRYETAKSFAEDLDRYLTGEPIAARPLSRRERWWREIRRRPVASTLAGAAAVAAVLLVLTVAVLERRTVERIDSFVREGDARLAREDFEAARTSYEKALALNPDHAGALHRKKFCDRAIEGRDKSATGHIAGIREVADALFESHAWEKAHSYYRKILAIDPSNEWAADRRRQCEMEIERARHESKNREDLGERIRLLEDGARRRSEARERAWPHFEAGCASLEASGRLKGRPDPSVADILLRYREAMESFGRALREDEGYAEARYLRGLARFRMAEFIPAEQDFAAAGPSFAAAVFQLAILHEARFQLHSRCPYVKSAEEVKAALSSQHKAIEAVLGMSTPAYERWCAKALSHLRARRFDDALEALDKIRVEGANRYAPVFLRAVVHLEAGNDAQALPVLIQALELEPTAYETLFLRALLRNRMDDLEGAAEDATKAIGVAPSLHPGYLVRAHLHQRRGDVRRARADLEAAAKLPGAPAVQIREVLENLRDSSDR